MGELSQLVLVFPEILDVLLYPVRVLVDGADAVIAALSG